MLYLIQTEDICTYTVLNVLKLVPNAHSNPFDDINVFNLHIVTQEEDSV